MRYNINSFRKVENSEIHLDSVITELISAVLVSYQL